LLGLKTVQEQL